MKTKQQQNKIVAIIGSGYVGSTIAYALTAVLCLDKIILIDCDEQRAKAEALDIFYGLDSSHDTKVISGHYCDITDADLIIVTAGRNRRPGEDRNDLLRDNFSISKKVATEIKKYYSGCPILIVTNPVDTLVYAYSKFLNLTNGMVFGTGCSLDSFRLSAVLSEYLSIPSSHINPCIIGEHGNDFEIIWRYTTIDGIPVKKYCLKHNVSWTDEIEKDIEKKVKEMGMQIILGKGKTQFGISTVVCHIAKSILNNENNVFNVSSVLNKQLFENSFNDVSLSMPCEIGVRGREKTIDLILTEEEKNHLIKIKNKLEKIKENLEIEPL